MCLDIKYVEGHEPDPESSVAFWCSTTKACMHNAIILGSSGCITDVDPHPAYDILITDEDAEDEIHTTAAVTITGVFVPNTTTTTFTTPSVSSTGLLRAILLFYVCSYTPTAQSPFPIVIITIMILFSKFIVRYNIVKQYIMGSR